MAEVSDGELEETDEVMEPCVHSSSSSDDQDDIEETEGTLQATRAGESSNVFDFTGPPNGVNQSAASNMNAESVHSSILILFLRWIFQIPTETNCYSHQYMSSKIQEALQHIQLIL
jgi:hypothetical protein